MVRSATRSRTWRSINEDLQECRGLLYAYDALYANANNSKGLYRLRDTDGDDRFDEVRLLREFPGGVGHGRNDLALGTDGLIYSIHGDSVDVPTRDDHRPHVAFPRSTPRKDNPRRLSRAHRSRRPAMGTRRQRATESLWRRRPSQRRVVHLRRRCRVRHGNAVVSADARRAASLRGRLRLARRDRPVAAVFPRSPRQRFADARHRPRLAYRRGIRHRQRVSASLRQGAVHPRLGLRPDAGRPSGAARRGLSRRRRRRSCKAGR